MPPPPHNNDILQNATTITQRCQPRFFFYLYPYWRPLNPTPSTTSSSTCGSNTSNRMWRKREDRCRSVEKKKLIVFVWFCFCLQVTMTLTTDIERKKRRSHFRSVMFLSSTSDNAWTHAQTVMMTRGSMLCCPPATLLTIEILSRRCSINFEWFCVCHDHCGVV